MRFWKKRYSPSAELKAAGEELVRQWETGIQRGYLSGVVWKPMEGNLPGMEYAVIGKRVILRARSEDLNELTQPDIHDNRDTGL